MYKPVDIFGRQVYILIKHMNKCSYDKMNLVK